MRIGLFAVGRLKAGPEKELAARYLDRFAKSGPAVGLELGKMTWPHQLVRILIAEQLYRAVTILSGHPYHRV